MSGDLVVASFEFDKESSSFGFPFCAQVSKCFSSSVLTRKSCRENSRKWRSFISIPNQQNPSFLNPKLRSFSMSWIQFFMWVIRVISRVICHFSWSFEADRMPSISYDLTLFHHGDYWNINLRCSIQHYRFSGESPAISSGNNLRNLSGHPSLPGSEEENKNNGDCQAR